MENQALSKTNKNGNLYIGINIGETIEYLKSLKKYKVNVSMDDEVMNFLFSKIRKKILNIENTNNNTENNNNENSIAKIYTEEEV